MKNNFLLHLSLIPGLGPAVAEKIIAALQAHSIAPDYWGELKATDILRYCRLPDKIAQALIEGLQDKSMLEKELALIEKYQIKWMTFLDPEYPPLLKHTHLPPIVLFWKGDISVTRNPCLAIIGARAATGYGHTAINELVPDIVAQGCTIVSGGAIGADTMAHRATLAAGGKTVAVIGSGLLRPYPSQNTRLFDEIVYSGGAVVSPFPLLMQGLPGNFPARNRIISGLSQGCLVVQAAQKSGALITARFALEQGRDVGAVPGSWNDPLSAGCHALIKEGALCVTSSTDALQLVGIQAREQTQEQYSIFSNNHAMTVSHIQQPLTPNLSKGLNAENASKASFKGSKDPLVLLCSQPISFDELLQKTGIEPVALQEKLFDLQLEGVLEQNFMGMWKSI